MELNKENMKKIRSLIIFTIIAFIVGLNYHAVLGLLRMIFGIIFPFVLGGAIAFVLNVPMRFLEKKFRFQKHEKLKRPVSLVLTLLFVLLILFFAGFLVIPELVRTIASLSESIPVFWQSVQSEAETFFANYPEIVSIEVQGYKGT